MGRARGGEGNDSVKCHVSRLNRGAVYLYVYIFIGLRGGEAKYLVKPRSRYLGGVGDMRQT